MLSMMNVIKHPVKNIRDVQVFGEEVHVNFTLNESLINPYTGEVLSKRGDIHTVIYQNNGTVSFVGMGYNQMTVHDNLYNTFCKMIVMQNVTAYIEQIIKEMQEAHNTNTMMRFLLKYGANRRDWREPQIILENCIGMVLAINWQSHTIKLIVPENKSDLYQYVDSAIYYCINNDIASYLQNLYELLIKDTYCR